MHRIHAGFLAWGVVAAMSACGSPAPLEFAEWTLPVPEGTPVKQYAAVPLSERTEPAFELIDDLTIGGDPDDPNASFYRPVAVVAADNGNIFVIENGSKRVQMFGPDGEFLKTLGGAGQGPGEFQMPMAAAISGERLVVVDAMNSRFSVWTSEGDHVGDHAVPPGSAAMRIGGLPDQRLAVLSTEVDIGALGGGSTPGPAALTMTTTLSAWSTTGERAATLLEVPNPPMPDPMALMSDPKARTRFMIERLNAPDPTFAVGAGDLIYVTLGTEYQIHALTPDGEMAWALRVAHPRRPYPESRKELRVRSLSRDDPDVRIDDFDWPAFDDAISGTLLTDGAGRLYVYPLFERAAREEADGEEEGEDPAAAEAPAGRAVDVYSPDGELLATGLSPGTWLDARGEFVYHFSRDAETDETVVVRSRLVLRDR